MGVSVTSQLLKCVMNLFIKCGRGGDMIFGGHAFMIMVMVFKIHMIITTGLFLFTFCKRWRYSVYNVGM